VTFTAYLFIGATVVLFGGFIATAKTKNEDDKKFGLLLLALLVMTFAGLGLALNEIGFNPRITF